MISAGMLRHRVTLRELVETDNDYGEKERSWQDNGSVWALVEDMRGRERYLARQAQSEVDATVTIRYRDDIVPTMRIAHGSRELQIDSIVRPDDRGRFLELLCREIPSDGT